MRWMMILLVLLAGCSTPVAESLSVRLSSDLQAELEMNASALCSAAGGESPYDYSWDVNGVPMDCGEVCDFHLGVGTHTVTCEVTDSGGRNTADALEIEVGRGKVDIDSVFVLGDSLSYGKGLDDPEHENWAYLLAQELGAELHNTAKNGATTTETLTVPILAASDTELTFLWIGSNDVINFIPLATFRTNYRRIVESLGERPYVVLINIPDASRLPVTLHLEDEVNQYAEALGIRVDVKGLTQGLIRSYNDEIDIIAREFGYPVIDMFSHMEGVNESEVGADRFHPSAEGHRAIELIVRNELEEKFPDYEFY